jgi:hypothetical protein
VIGRKAIVPRHAVLLVAILSLVICSAGDPAMARAEDTEAVEVDAGVDWPAGTDADSAVESGVRKVWDILFWRPMYVVQLVGGVVALPVALPLAALVGDWRDSIDICVTGPTEMAFGRPLGQ